jgi:hypothetical protein
MVIGDTRLQPTIELVTTENGRQFKSASQLYVATPAVLRYLGIDPTTIRPSADFLNRPPRRDERLNDEHQREAAAHHDRPEDRGR